MTNTEIADTFDKLADLLEVEDANAYRVRAYRNAARTVRDYSRSMADLLGANENLSKLPNIGKDLAAKIGTLVEGGRLPLLEEVQQRVPAALSELMDVEGLGPRKVKQLYRELDTKSLGDLQRAAENHEIRELKGFGKRTEELIRRHVDGLFARPARITLQAAEDEAKPLLGYLGAAKGVKKLAIAGSSRRWKETVGDLDILVTVKRGTDIIGRFVSYEGVDEVVSKGTTRSTVKLRSGLQVDMRVVPQASHGAALHYFTGSKAHNIAVRRIGVRCGLKINEYGVFEGEERIAGKTEREVYDAVGLPFIPPELREDRGEIEAARAGKLPKLAEPSDMRGDLHSHTKASDGRHTIEQMAEAAQDRRYQYLAITDHSRRVRVAHGLDEKPLRRQLARIDRVNEELDGIVILKATEVDILDDGSLDLPDRILEQVDVAVCSVHYGRNPSRKKQTERVLKAMDNPHFNILAHPTGRLINEREPYAINLERVIEGAKERGCFLELNAHPDRLDLTDEACMLAKDLGVKVAISTDAHSTDGLNFMCFGVAQARRGWLSAADVINTLSLAKLRKLLDRK